MGRAGILVGFESEDDWSDYRLEHDPRFLRRMETATQSIRAGRGFRLEGVAKYKTRRLDDAALSFVSFPLLPEPERLQKWNR